MYLYGIVAGRPTGTAVLPPRLRAVRRRGLTAVVSDFPSPPAPAPAALRAHDRAVRRIARVYGGVLPARFGTTFATDTGLRAVLDGNAPGLREAWARARGHEQMVVRVHGEPGLLAAEHAPRGGGRGRRHLALRAAAHDPRRAPALAGLFAAVQPLVAAEHVEPQRAPFLSAIYHLVPRGRAAAYRRAANRAARALPSGLEVVVSGPWPPYAFAPRLRP